jgi:hypothetical protein
MHHFDFAKARLLEARSKHIGIRFGGYRNHFGPPASNLFECDIQIGAGSQSNNLEAVRVGFRDTERAAADRAGRSQDGDASHNNENRRRNLILRVKWLRWGGGRSGHCMTRQAA